jgi:hypothetical protein
MFIQCWARKLQRLFDLSSNDELKLSILVVIGWLYFANLFEIALKFKIFDDFDSLPITAGIFCLPFVFP